MTDKQVIILSYILVLSIPLFAGLGVGLFFFAKYLIRREKQQDIEDRQSTAAIKKNKRLVRLIITGCWVCWVLFVLLLVLTLGTGIRVVILLFAGFGLFFFAKYLMRRAKRQNIEDRQSTAAIKKAISRKKRLVRFFITGCWVCWVLFVLMLVLTLRGRVDIDDIPAVWLYILVLPVFSLAVFGYDRSPSVVSNLRQEIRELEGAQSSMTEGKGL